MLRGLSSAGRASALQAEGHRFEPYRPHVTIAGWSSLEARWAHNPKVAGSNPAPAIFIYIKMCPGSSVGRAKD